MQKLCYMFFFILVNNFQSFVQKTVLTIDLVNIESHIMYRQLTKLELILAHCGFGRQENKVNHRTAPLWACLI